MAKCPKKDYKFIPKCPKTTIECGNKQGYCFDPNWNEHKMDHEQGRMISTYFEPQFDSCVEDDMFSGNMPRIMDSRRIWTRFEGRYYKRCNYLKKIKPEKVTINTEPWFPDLQWRNPKIGLFGKRIIWKKLIEKLKNRPIGSSCVLTILNDDIIKNPIIFIGIKKTDDKIKIYPLRDWGIIKRKEYIFIDMDGNLIS